MQHKSGARREETTQNNERFKSKALLENGGQYVYHGKDLDWYKKVHLTRFDYPSLHHTYTHLLGSCRPTKQRARNDKLIP